MEAYTLWRPEIESLKMTTYGNGYLLTPLTPSMPTCPPIVDRIPTLPSTPPDSAELCPAEKSTRVDSKLVKQLLHVVSSERDAITNLHNLYASSRTAQSSFCAAIKTILASQSSFGKVVFTGVGKSGWIAQKLVATFNSIGIVSVFLHPTEALHGDLGIIRPNDVVMMITYSGKTQELLTLLPHVPSYVPLMVITSHRVAHECPLLTYNRRAGCQNILLPAPIHISEKESFGLSAPTMSTTVALALGDSIALTVADEMHAPPNPTTAEVFALNHPGGAIGVANMGVAEVQPRILDMAIQVRDVHLVSCSEPREATCLEALLSAVRSPGGWVKITPSHIISPRRCQKFSDLQQQVKSVNDDRGPLVVERTDWISIPGNWTVEECRSWIVRMRTEGDARGRAFLRPGTILGIVDNHSEKSGVIEIEDIVGEDFCSTL